MLSQLDAVARVIDESGRSAEIDIVKMDATMNDIGGGGADIVVRR